MLTLKVFLSFAITLEAAIHNNLKKILEIFKKDVWGEVQL